MNERVWQESADTAKGRAEHGRVHTQRVEKRGDLVKLYDFTVFSDEIKLSGKCDCIEAVHDDNGCSIPAVSFPVSLCPIEYKHGTVRDEREYEIQLCAQAMCLEEMFHTTIAKGDLFYISSHRRVTVDFTEELRKEVTAAAQNLRLIRDTLSVPKAEYSAKCKKCSIREICMPKTKKSAERYCAAMETEAKSADEL